MNRQMDRLRTNVQTEGQMDIWTDLGLGRARQGLAELNEAKWTKTRLSGTRPS